MAGLQNCASYIVKVSGRCNLSCSYCYYYNGASQEGRTKMGTRTIERILQQTALRSNHVSLEWHGGEPLLLGIKAFEAIMEKQRSITNATGAKFRNVVQTNATLIDESWARFFKENDFKVGVSLDGPKWLHDAHRCYPSGRGTYEDTCRGIRVLQEHDIRFGVLAVVTRESIGHETEIMDLFADLDIKRIGLLPCVELDFHRSSPGHPELMACSLRPGDLSSFLNRMYDLWLERDDPSINIRELEQVLIGLVGGRPTLCAFSANCPNLITIDYDGGVGPCSSLAASNLNGPSLRFGNIRKQPLDRILEGKRRESFMQSCSLSNGCMECRYLGACGGGCSKYRFMWSGDWRERNYFCDDRKCIFDHVAESLRKNHPDLRTCI